MLQVKQIVNDIFTSNTYMLFDDDYDYCWLVDIGDFNKVADVLPSGIEIRGVFLTHSHFDHIYGLNALHKAFPQCKVYTSAYGREALYNDKKNFSKYHEASFKYEGTDIVEISDGDSIELYPDTILNIYATPGHCPSCLTYSIGGWVFTGDSYIPGVKVVTKLPKGDRELSKRSVDKILQLAQNKKICPGHGIVV